MTENQHDPPVVLVDAPVIVRSWTPPKGLEFDATPQQILVALLEMGFTTNQLRSDDVLDCSDATLRNWTEGKSVPRGRSLMVLDDMRATVVALHAAGIRGERAQQWLFKRSFGRMIGGRRPIELLTTTPLRLLSAVQDLMSRDPNGPPEEFHLQLQPEPVGQDERDPQPGTPTLANQAKRAGSRRRPKSKARQTSPTDALVEAELV